MGLRRAALSSGLPPLSTDSEDNSDSSWEEGDGGASDPGGSSESGSGSGSEEGGGITSGAAREERGRGDG